MTTIYIWESGARWLCLVPGRSGTSGQTKEEALRQAREWSNASLQIIESAPPGVAR
jgi:hypothetical protein